MWVKVKWWNKKMSSPVISACKKVAEMSKVDILHPKAMDKVNRSFKVVKEGVLAKVSPVSSMT
jgi:hypothetical protein